MGTTGPQTAAEAFATVNFRNVLPAITRYAHACVRSFGWGESEHRRSGVMQAEDLVNTTIELLLSGKREWVAGTGKTEKSLIAFVCMTMKSVASHEYWSAGQTARERGLVALRALERAPGRGASAHKLLEARTTLAAFRAAIADDAELVRYVDVLDEGTIKREEIAKAMRIAPADVSVIRKRLLRLLEAKGIAPVLADDPSAPEDTAETADEDEEHEEDAS